VIGRSIGLAAARSVASAAVTFDRDPELILVPEQQIPQICTLDQKIRFIAELDPDYLLVLPFDRQMASLSPQDFLKTRLLRVFTPRVVVVGTNFRFGAGGAGDVEALTDFGAARRILGPDVAFNARISPVLMKNGAADEVAAAVKDAIDQGAPLNNYSIDTVGLTHGTPDENVRAARRTAMEFGKIS